MKINPIIPEDGNLPQFADGADGLAMKCAPRGCRWDGGEQFCVNTQCGRVIHYECYKMQYHLPDNKVCCTKKCYDKFKSSSTRSPLCIEDGVNGKDDPRTSESIVIDWILEPSNYITYRGKNNDGTKKN